ncbi:MAG: tRNA 2-thiouridine(34) synthase MnmA [Bacteroidia bacterium]|nr:tRNA 2-thiouridine(34) synthase MnmA [Bacteroidia bacterium]
MQRVAIGLSGGVDSSVAAYLLKQQGYDVVALFMKNWHDTIGLLSGDCPSNDDVIFAQLVARKLDIPFYVVDLSEQYSKRVVGYLFSEYEKGRTPNPDVLCNREIKFDVFAAAAASYGADLVATGHYCRKESLIKDGKKVHRLLAGTDRNKDQSYFLCQLSQEQLNNVLFPVGGLLKPEVRKIAAELSLATATRKDSQGICFVGKVDLPVFLQQKIQSKKGDIIEIPANYSGFKTYFNIDLSDPDEEALFLLSQPHSYRPSDGKKLGEHIGAHFYTIGQRKGLHIGGKREALFVIATDIEQNIVYVGMGQEHPGLHRPALFIKKDEIHWIRPDLALQPDESARFMFRIRYRQPLQKGRLFTRQNGAYIIFDSVQRGITPGQFAAWYNKDELIGSGVINA